MVFAAGHHLDGGRPRLGLGGLESPLRDSDTASRIAPPARVRSKSRRQKISG